MSNEEENYWRKGKRLSEAWLEFADYGYPERGMKARVQALRWDVPNQSAERIEAGKTPYDFQVKKLQYEFLGRLFSEEFVAFGRDLSKGIASPIVRIPAGVFRDYAEDFSIEWEDSSFQSYGSKLIEVRVLPTDQLDQAENAQPEIPTGPTPTDLGEVQVRKPGKPNVEKDFKAAVLDAIDENAHFLFEGDRTSQAREIRARLFGEGARMRDNMTGCTLDVAKRWVGEVATARRRPPA